MKKTIVRRKTQHLFNNRPLYKTSLLHIEVTVQEGWIVGAVDLSKSKSPIEIWRAENV